MPSSYVANNETVPLYRFVSFFDLYDILVNRRLRFSKLATMQDKNEGIGVILRGQEDIIFRQAHIDSARIPKIHTYALENHYISCWTMEAEAMSMWSLYSPDSETTGDRPWFSDELRGNRGLSLRVLRVGSAMEVARYSLCWHHMRCDYSDWSRYLAELCHNKVGPTLVA